MTTRTIRMGTALVACALCGRTGIGRYRQTPAGVTTCADHPWCVECATAHLRLPCPEQAGRIPTNAQAAAESARVLADLAGLGIQLPRVPLELVTRLPGQEQGLCRKQVHRAGSNTVRTADIQVLSGLGPTRFGHVVAHEHTHALMHLQGAVPLDPELEEGVCEMVAVVWLTHRKTSHEQLQQVWRNPHPVYGEQMRRVVRAARRQGVGVTLNSVLTAGQL